MSYTHLTSKLELEDFWHINHELVDQIKVHDSHEWHILPVNTSCRHTLIVHFGSVFLPGKI